MKKSIIALSLCMILGTSSVTALANNANQTSHQKQQHHLLFIQTAKYGNIIPNKNNPTTGTLVLHKVSKNTKAYRQDDAGKLHTQSTNDFIKKVWIKNKKYSFKNVPPNASVSYTVKSTQQHQTKVFELSNPTIKGNKVTYQIASLDKRALQPLTISQVSIKIDDWGPW